MEVARQARAAHVPIYTVALGTSEGTITGDSGATLPVPPDPETMAEIAAASGGEASTSTTPSELDAVYERLGSQIATRPEQREITAGFAAGGMVLLLARRCALPASGREASVRGDTDDDRAGRLWSGENGRRAAHEWAAPRRPARGARAAAARPAGAGRRSRPSAALAGGCGPARPGRWSPPCSWAAAW